MNVPIRPQHFALAAILLFFMGPQALLVIAVAFLLYRSNVIDPPAGIIVYFFDLQELIFGKQVLHRLLLRQGHNPDQAHRR